jgi:hypothetical protein
MIILGLLLFTVWAGFGGAPWWSAFALAPIAALNELVAPIIWLQMQHGLVDTFRATRAENGLVLLLPLALAQFVKWSVILLAPLFLGRGLAWLLT